MMDRQWTLYVIYFAILFLVLEITSAKNSDAIKGPPTLLTERSSQQKLVNEGKDVKLTCPVTGNPEPIYEWWKDSNPIPEDSWERFKVQRSSLKIKEVVSEDRGAYTCKAVNGFGHEQFVFYLHIQASLGNVLSSSMAIDELKVDQVFPVSGSTVTKLTGQSVRFKCFVTGDPEPDINWYKNGRLLNPSHYDRETQGDFTEFRNSKYSLQLTDLTSWDSGNYTCEAMNIHGAITVNWTLDVVSKIPVEKQETSPLQLSNLTTVSGEDAVLRCRGTWDSEISPKVKWLRQIDPLNLRKFPENETFAYKGRYYQVLQPTELLVMEDGYFLTKLVVHDAQLRDSGTYVCTATNRYGLNFREATLHVIERDSNFGHVILVVSLSLVVFVIVSVAVVATLRRKRAKRLPPQQLSLAGGEQSKMQLEPYGRPLLPPPNMISDHGELQPRYVVYPHTAVSSHNQQRSLPEDQSNPSIRYDGVQRLNPSVGHIAALPTQGSEGSNQGQPIIVYQDTPRSTYVSSSSRYHLQNFDVI